MVVDRDAHHLLQARGQQFIDVVGDVQVGRRLLMQGADVVPVVVAAHGIASARCCTAAATVQDTRVGEDARARRCADCDQTRLAVHQGEEVGAVMETRPTVGATVRAGHDVGSAVDQVELGVAPDDERPERERRIRQRHAPLVDVQVLQATAGVHDGPVRTTETEAFAHDLGQQAIHQRAPLRCRGLELDGIAEHGAFEDEVVDQLRRAVAGSS